MADMSALHTFMMRCCGVAQLGRLQLLLHQHASLFVHVPPACYCRWCCSVLRCTQRPGIALRLTQCAAASVTPVAAASLCVLCCRLWTLTRSWSTSA
jgi:hypothetical protein